MSKSPVTSSLYPKFFAMERRATAYLGIDDKEAKEAYHKRVLSECAQCTSMKQIASLNAFDACLKRFAADAGDYAGAIDYEQEKLKRTAYVCKVMAAQIMQLNDLDESNARNYFEGILDQSRLSVGFRSSGGSFFLDMSLRSLHTVLQILDTHLRRLKREHFPTFPLSFDDRIRYVRDGNLLTREKCEKYYYHNLAFMVNLTS